jgi:hypothetical protein
MKILMKYEFALITQYFGIYSVLVLRGLLHPKTTYVIEQTGLI